MDIQATKAYVYFGDRKSTDTNLTLLTFLSFLVYRKKGKKIA